MPSLTSPQTTATQLDDTRPSVVVLRLAASADQVARARRAALELAERAHLSDHRRADIALAVGEVCSNAVLHAYPDREDGTFTLRATASDGRVEILVEDDGCGLRPRDDSPGAGFGLPIVASLTSALELRAGRSGGSAVRMVFDDR